MTSPTDTPEGLPEALGGSSTLRATVLATLVIGAVLFLTSWAAPVLAPLGMGLFLTALAAPLFGWFMARGRSATTAVVVTVLVVVLVAGGIALLLLYSGRQLADSLATYADRLSQQYPPVADALLVVGVPGAVLDLLSPEAMVSILESVVAIIANVGGQVAFAVVLSALLLLDAPRIGKLVRNGLGSQNPIFREYPGVARAAVTYFMIRIRVNALTAGGLLAVLLVLGVDDAVLWAVGAFFLSFVPYIGLVLAIIPPTILAFAESGPGAAIAVIVGGTVLNVVAENVLEPSMTGRALSLATWLVFAMFFLTVWLLGPVGALLAMPITVLVVLVLERNETTRWIATLLTRHGSEPSTEAAPARSV